MSNFLTSSIGKKVIMSLSGLFLISFLCVHLALNLLLIFDNSGALFNQGAHFMATNPIIKIIEPILAIGFIIHIIWASVLTLQNQKARPVKYALRNQSQNATWYNFWWNIKFPSLGTPLAAITIGGVEMEDTYTLVSSLFESSIVYCLIYILGAVLVGLHITHGFWSAFQTIGFSNDIWRKRLECLAYFFAIVFAVGFSIIPLYFIAGLGN